MQNLNDLNEVKEHFAAFGSLPLETMTTLFELAEKQLAPVTVEAAPPKKVKKAE